MADFNSYLDLIGEVGYVEKIFQVLIYVNGLPGVRPTELVVFESGETGQVLSLTENYAEVLLLSNTRIDIGTQVARTGKQLNVLVGPHLLGRTISPLGNEAYNFEIGRKQAKLPDPKLTEARPIHVKPLGMSTRKNIDKPFETGVAVVDMLISLGKGQRELVAGDRKTGKTPFLLQTALSAVQKGAICVYAAIGKKRSDISKVDEFFKANGLGNASILVATSSSDPASMIYLTPLTAMTIAEYFRDQGKDVLLVLDDMTTHAKYYREITLLAKRFPGRSSYPGDIFYIHASLMERAGNFWLSEKTKNNQIARKEVAITCLPVAELVMGDLSGYIQTNLMSMTDGHIFFDTNLFNEGRRPAINPFTSVTRVGRQTQNPVVLDLSRVLSRFLVHQRELEQFMHFGTELAEKSKQELELGNRLREFLNQTPNTIIPLPVGVFVVAGIWMQIWKNKEPAEFKQLINAHIAKYASDLKFHQEIDQIFQQSESFEGYIEMLKTRKTLLSNENSENKEH